MARYTYGPNDDSRFPYRANRDGAVFQTEHAAVNYCQMWNDYYNAMRPIDDVPLELSRVDYDRICTELGVEVLSDVDITGPFHYAVRNGDFAPRLEGEEIGGYPPAHCQEMAMARRRLRAIMKERESQPAVSRPQPELVRCSCGHSVARQLVMTASLGTACPDCYDEMSG